MIFETLKEAQEWLESAFKDGIIEKHERDPIYGESKIYCEISEDASLFVLEKKTSSYTWKKIESKRRENLLSLYSD